MWKDRRKARRSVWISMILTMSSRLISKVSKMTSLSISMMILMSVMSSPMWNHLLSLRHWNTSSPPPQPMPKVKVWGFILVWAAEFVRNWVSILCSVHCIWLSNVWNWNFRFPSSWEVRLSLFIWSMRIIRCSLDSFLLYAYDFEWCFGLWDFTT